MLNRRGKKKENSHASRERDNAKYFTDMRVAHSYKDNLVDTADAETLAFIRQQEPIILEKLKKFKPLLANYKFSTVRINYLGGHKYSVLCSDMPDEIGQSIQQALSS